MRRGTVTLLLLLAFVFSTFAQADTSLSEVKKTRLRTVIAAEAILYTGSMIALGSAWYDEHDKSGFHFFNDNDEWLQMDKAGHAATSYHIGRLGIDVFRWSGIKEKHAIIYGGSLGFVYLASIEVFDGFSESYGASYGDLIANAAGSALLISQELAFDGQPVSLKYSFSRTSFPKMRPEVLGANWPEELLKDYNAQTYWASCNLKSFFPSSGLPSWLNVAFGYGAHGMTGGKNNVKFNESGLQLPSFERYRQYYLSLDVDLYKIRTRSKFLNTVLKSAGFLKIPFPALEYNRIDGLLFHPLFY